MSMRKLLLWSPPILVLGIVAGVLLVNLGGFGSSSASLKLTNRSATEISDISVSLYTRACTIERLQPAQSAVCNLAIESDAYYSITWTESQHADFEERAGYVTNGFDFSHELTFLGDGKIEFSLREAD